MKKQFREFLVSEGYSERTPSGNKSTVDDYCLRVERILQWEGVSWNESKRKILILEQKYDVGGIKEDVGKKSHGAYINALRAYKRFCERT